MTDTLNLNGYMITIDFEKAFDSLNHDFLLNVLSIVAFPEYYIDWIRIILNKHGIMWSRFFVQKNIHSKQGLKYPDNFTELA